MERTLVIVKPDATERRLAGKILARLEEEGFLIRGLGLLRLTTSQAEEFYEVHRGKPFFPDLVSFMCSGPTVVAALEGEDAVRRLRRVVGATDPSEAEPGTIRRQFGLDVQRNSVHASDSPSTAARELVFFFGSGAGDGSGEGALAGERTIV